MQIDLSESDVLILKEALSVHMSEIQSELVRTDDRQYREYLRSQLFQLESILLRMEGSPAKQFKTG
ncbi:MAG: hypothetical protein AABZ06_15130 [Bdellovibrionota bacterium]